MSPFQPLTGSCPCTLLASPLFTHCCHCTSCRHESGTAFCTNALTETYNFQLTPPTQPLTDIEYIDISTESGQGQRMARCSRYKTCVWSNYGDPKDVVRMVRVGTLDQAENVPPDLHIYARSMLPWVVLGEEVPSVDGWYDREKVWPKESLERLRVCRERADKGE